MISILDFVFQAVILVLTTFALVNTCSVPTSCTCYNSSISYRIRCSHKKLTNVPSMLPSNIHVHKLYLFFNVNLFTVIPNNVFETFSFFNASDVYLTLSNNNIRLIENDAFNGIENVITDLNLYSNNLMTIPFAISKLVNLKTLKIQKNPLRSLDSSVMAHIGQSLTYFSLDLNHFTKMPRELRYLRVLQSLTINHIPFSHMDVNAFQGVNHTLKTLYLEYSKLEKMPLSICRLSNLSLLSFTYDSYLKENKSSILMSCGCKLPSVTRLYLHSNSLHTFPDIFALFPSLTLLHMLGNNLQYIDYEKIPNNSNLTNLLLTNNLFDRVPYALNRLKFLKSLSLDGNNIKTIDTPDLVGLHSLTYLGISSNPIMFIAPDAFKHNVNLRHLRLYNTHLKHIPVAVTTLTKLFEIDLDGMSIECTCDMSYLKHWNVSTIDIEGNCPFSSESIKYFIMHSLQSCP
ncbi:leucine-rich repeat protein soc-2 homolog [Ruditapes philippinarum]|uniref:leucine-rich repeat protein soc-2 homolog n=1 Tax=Ruditapes philippinarum TaxID=129788 RepID=UPI00295A616F|nr:leucine-rich repeat protein soc-2 homolog [Ruditapes philippinarum]